MKERLEKRTLNKKLLKEGFTITACIPNNNLFGKLFLVLADISKREYEDIKIVSGDIAFKGSGWSLAEPSHLIYIKYREKPERHSYRVKAFLRYFISEKSEDINIIPLRTL